MAENIVQFNGRFGNQLWETSAAIKTFGEGNFKVYLGHCGEKERDAFKLLQNLEIVDEISPADYVMPLSFYQHKKWLVEPQIISKYIKKPDDVPYYENVIHIRLGDYTQLPSYTKCLMTKEELSKNLNELNLSRKDCVVFSDDNGLKVIERYGIGFKKIIKPLGTLQAFWSMVQCNNLICSASTFSYWAAYLNPNHSFVLPKRWPCELSKDDPNMYHSFDDLKWY